MKLISAKPLLDFLALMAIFTFLLWILIALAGIGSHSVFYAWAIVATNAVLGYVLFEYGYAIKSPHFFRTVLLGQAMRLFFVAAAIVALTLLRVVELAPFAWSVIGFYAVYLPIEVLACLGRMKMEKRLEKLRQLF